MGEEDPPQRPPTRNGRVHRMESEGLVYVASKAVAAAAEDCREGLGGRRTRYALGTGAADRKPQGVQ